MGTWMVSAQRTSSLFPSAVPDRMPLPCGSSFSTVFLLTCEDVGKGIATGDLQGWMLGPEDIQKERRETTQDA